MDGESLRVAEKRRHKEDGEACPLGCGEVLHEHHDNFSCDGCSYVDWDNHALPRTGIFIRAKDPAGKWGSFDVAELDDASFSWWVNERLDDDGRFRLILVLLGRPIDF